VRAKIRDRPLRLEEALDIAIQAAEGLAAAHQKGVVHRDIKSSNLMVTSTGQLKVMDFGLAQLTGETRLTKTDTVVGTPAYMSPEQAQRQLTDRRTDIWSLGVVLYEMLTGRLPFEGEREAAVVHAIIQDSHEPVTALRAGVPLELDRILSKALSKSPAQRYQHLDDMLVDLRAVRSNLSGQRALTAREPLPRRWLWPVAAAALLMAGYLAWRAGRGPGSMEPFRAVPLTTLRGLHRSPSFSPDGNQVAFTWTGVKGNNPDIYVQMIGVGSPLQLTRDPGNDYNPIWSPDGQSIAFLRRQSDSQVSELLVIPPLGGTERKMTELRIRDGFSVTPPYVTWCPDGTCFIATNSPGEGKPDALFVISIETGEKKQLTYPNPPTNGDSHPAISPDGSWLVFRRPAGGMYTGALYRVRLGKDFTAADEPQRITPMDLDAGFPTWMPNGEEILLSGRAGLWKLAVPGEAKPARVPFVGEDGLMPVVSQPQPGKPSRLAYVRSFLDDNIWRVETSAPGVPASSQAVISVASTRRDDMPQLSPDGRRVAFTSDRSGEWEIWAADPDGANAMQLTNIGAIASGYPHWSPDGSQIVFHSNVEGQWDVFVVPSTGGKVRNLTSPPFRDYFPSYSRDGRWIYFNSSRSGATRIWKMPAPGGDAVQVTNDAGEAPQESPDGAWLYFVQNIEGASPLWRIPVAGGAPVKVLDNVDLVNFVVMEKGIYYIDRILGGAGIHYLDRSAGETRLRYFDLATRRSVTIANNLGNVDVPLSASRDGRTIIYPRVDSAVDDLMLVENFR
jgi:Tol biopolymer transport system component